MMFLLRRELSCIWNSVPSELCLYWFRKLSSASVCRCRTVFVLHRHTVIVIVNTGEFCFVSRLVVTWTGTEGCPVLGLEKS